MKDELLEDEIIQEKNEIENDSDSFSKKNKEKFYFVIFLE